MAFAPSLLAAEKSKQKLISELFSVIDRADEMIVYSGGFRREHVVLRSSKRKDFEELKSAITLKDDGGPFACACIDGPDISLLKNKKEIAAIWNHEGTAIGSSVWNGDWENDNPDRWMQWFDQRGLRQVREDFNSRQEKERKSAEDERRWLDAMPSSAKPFWPDLIAHSPPSGVPDLKPLEAALAQQYPDAYERIRILLAWYGSGSGPWSGFPAYEQVAEQLLRDYPTSELIKAVEGRQLTEQELEGTARILASWTPTPDPTPIPQDLRRILLEHSLKSTDEDKTARAKARFSGK